MLNIRLFSVLFLQSSVNEQVTHCFHQTIFLPNGPRHPSPAASWVRHHSKSERLGPPIGLRPAPAAEGPLEIRRL
jgi:hypothetical protein